MAHLGLKGAGAGGLPGPPRTGCGGDLPPARGGRSGWDVTCHRELTLPKCWASANRAGLLVTRLVILTSGYVCPCDTPFTNRLFQTKAFCVS